ncbi:MAG: large subunit ribosomal protein L10 [Hyphomonadaceae bacterium]|nr:MAG: large subunit ribosomal protein L10 [Hyphomonadaceae bacterium]KAF0183007.1 MAG: large subunit ribosomal protein L10 [Hyphomonadaceae bacterium]
MDKAGKAQIVEELKGLFAENNVVVFAHYSGLTVAELTSLRIELAKVGAGVKVVKNRLARLAMKGHDGEAAHSLLVGPTAIGFSIDPTAAPKTMTEFAKKFDNFQVIGGFMGATVLNADGVSSLATLPSLDELRGKIIGIIQAPASKIAAVVQAPAAQLARVVKAYADKEAA